MGPGIRTASVGITPPGALGVALFFHLTRGLHDTGDATVFVGREGSASCRALLAAGRLRIATPDREVELPLAGRFLLDPLAAWRDGSLPEVLLVAANPDQLFDAIDLFVQLTEATHQAGLLDTPHPPLPLLVLCANGIYHQRTRQVLLEKLEESTLLGRLPDLWPSTMPILVGRLLRGVALQTAARSGSGADALYTPGPALPTVIAGGLPDTRARTCTLLSSRGALVENAGPRSATAAEFRKALVNLSANLLGLLIAIGDDGTFRPITIGEIYHPGHDALRTELVHHLHAVGRAVGGFGPEETEATLLAYLHGIRDRSRAHIPSSLQWLDAQLRSGGVPPGLPPTERWLLDPLLHYARATGHPAHGAYFAALRDRLTERLQSARLAP